MLLRDGLLDDVDVHAFGERPLPLPARAAVRWNAELLAASMRACDRPVFRGRALCQIRRPVSGTSAVRGPAIAGTKPECCSPVISGQADAALTDAVHDVMVLEARAVSRRALVAPGTGAVAGEFLMGVNRCLGPGL